MIINVNSFRAYYVFRPEIVFANTAEHQKSVPKLFFTSKIQTMAFSWIKNSARISVSANVFRSFTLHTFARMLFYCPPRCDPCMILIHRLSLPILTARHAAIHTVASHLQAPCFVWSLFCFPWISLQGAELADLSDWCIGGVSSAIAFLTSVQWLHSTSLVWSSYVDTDVSNSVYCGEKCMVNRESP